MPVFSNLPISELLRSHSQDRADKLAFADATRDVSYGELARRTARLAGHFQLRGLDRGDRVAMLMGNRVEMVESYLAITRSAAVGVPLNPHSSDDELAHLLDDSGARFVITDFTHFGQVERMRAERPALTVVLVHEAYVAGTLSFSHCAATEPNCVARDDLALDEPAWMLYTSGTTGRPKGVLSTQRSCLWSVHSCYQCVLGLTADDRLLWPLPLFHSLAHILLVLGVTATGAGARILPGFAVQDIVESLRAEPVTMLVGVPAMYHQLVEALGEDGLGASHLRVCLVSGAAMSAPLGRILETSMGVPVVDSYGSTETCGAITMSRPDAANVSRTCGAPVPGVDVRLVDPQTGRDATPDGEGEVLVKGPNIMLGYHNRPDASAEAMRGGWYHTGDLARRDVQGRLAITGRISEIIIRAGENIHPGDIEAVLRTVPGVADVAVGGQPHEVLGEAPVGYVVADPEGWSPEAAIELCRERLSYFKVPQELREVGVIPRTASGKIRRNALAEVASRLRGVGTSHLETGWQMRWEVPTDSGTDPKAGPEGAIHWALIGADLAEVRMAVHAVGGVVQHLPEMTDEFGTGTFDGYAVNLASIAGAGLERTLEILEGLTADLPVDRPVVLITRGAVKTRPGENVDPAGAALWAWARARQDEQLRLVDLPGDPDDSGPAVEPAAVKAWEFVLGGHAETAIRGRDLLVPRLERIAIGPEITRPNLDPPGTVLITGADTELGSILAAHLVTGHRIEHLTLTGTDSHAVNQLAGNLGALGGTVATVPAQAASSAGVATMLAGAGRQVVAIVHVLRSPADAVMAGYLGAAAIADGINLTLCGSGIDAEGLDAIDSAATAFAIAAAGPAVGTVAFSSVLDPFDVDPVDVGQVAGGGAVIGQAGLVPLSAREVSTGFDLAWSGRSWFCVLHPDTLALREAAADLTPAARRLKFLLRDGASGVIGDGRPVIEEIRARLCDLPVRAQRRLLTELVCAEIRAMLDTQGSIDVGRTFTRLGFSSVAAVGLRNRLSAAIGVRLAATLAFDHPTPSAVADHLLDQLLGNPAIAVRALDGRGVQDVDRQSQGGTATDDPVVIVGMGCRYPGGVTSPADLWQLVSQGVDAVGDFPVDRGWDLERLFAQDGTGSGGSATRYGGFLNAPGDFDPAFFGISPREALAMDPQQRLLLEVGWEAIERAGIDPRSLRGTRGGSYIGLMFHDYATGLGTVPDDLEGYLGTGNAGSVASGRIAYTLGLTGPAITVDTACSSSLVAIHLAAQAIQRGECSFAIAGGVAVMATPQTFVEFSRQRGLATDGRCKAFADGADGTGWSEGVGIVVLERLSDAQRLGHQVLAVIRGSAINQDGASNGLTAPSGAAQQLVIRQALATAGLGVTEVDVVEAHGTGTKLGDPIEATAVLATYGQRPADRPVRLGSIKSNIGHAQSAAGVGAVIKMVEAMRHGELPRSLHIDRPSTAVDWTTGAVQLLTENTAWPRSGAIRRAGISSFGVSGTNAHVILEEPPVVEETPILDQSAVPGLDNRSLAIEDIGDGGRVLPFVISGVGDAALRRQAAKLVAMLGDTSPDLASLGAALACTRTGFEQRAVVVAAGRTDLIRGLMAISNGEPATGVLRGRADDRPLAIAFTGQGSQRLGMGRELHAMLPAFAEAFDAVCVEMDRHLDRPLREVVWAEPGTADAELLHRTDYTQPAIFAVEVALFRLIESWGIAADLLIGHSVGELAAAHVAQVLSLPDAALLVAARGRLMAGLPSGGSMLAVAASEDEVLSVIGTVHGEIAIAAVNGPNAVVISGADVAVGAARDALAAMGCRTTALRVSHAFHSPLMEPMLAEFREVAARMTFRAPCIPIMSNVTGSFATAAELCSPDYWVRHVRVAVRFADGVAGLVEQGVGTILELGPDGVLTAMARDTVDETQVALVSALRRGRSEKRELLSALGLCWAGGVDVDFSEFYSGPPTERVELPTYAFQHRRFWLPTEIAKATGNPAALGMTAAGHPMLGAAVGVAEAGGFLITGSLSTAALPWLADHAVLGRKLLPGAALVELAVHAGGMVGSGQLTELVIEAPVALPEHGGLDLQIWLGQPADDGLRPLRFHTRPQRSDRDEPWIRHASGSLSAEASAPAVTQCQTTSAWLPAGAEPLDIDDFYPARSAAGLDYGPAFRGLRAAWRVGTDVLAEISLPDGVDPAGYIIHPALLDASLHALDLLNPGSAERAAVRMPFAWTGVSVSAAGATSCRVRISPVREDVIAVQITDPGGRPVATIGALTLLPAQDVSSGAPQSPRSAYRWDWAAVPAAARQEGARWAVLGDGELAADLRAAGLVVVAHGGFTDLVAAIDAGQPVPAAIIAGLPSAPDTPSVATTAALQLVQQFLSAETVEARLIVLTRGAVGTSYSEPPRDLGGAAVWGLVRSAMSEHAQRPMTLVDIDSEPSSMRALAMLPFDIEPQIAIRNGLLLAPRLAELGATLALPAESSWQLQSLSTGTLDHLELIGEAGPRRPLAAQEVRICVRAAGLNFRDVLLALGVYPESMALGGEAAGVVAEVGENVTDLHPGDHVMGLFPAAFADSAVAVRQSVARMPAGWSFAQAAAAPVAFLTAAYGLSGLASLRPGERVLIHSAAGGVGMAAVQIAKSLGAEVFGTASPGKWSTLRSLGLDDAHIANSRTVEFADTFLAATAGLGMAVVLDALAGEFVDAGLRLLPHGGRFLEIGKADIRDATEVGIAHPGVQYTAFDLKDAGPDGIHRMLDELVNLADHGVLQPLPVTAWDIRQAPDAFRHMQQARHTGKVVLTTPAVIDQHGTVLITGGTGGLASQVARHLANKHGIRHLLLVSRRGSTADGVVELVRALAGLGASAEVVACDVTDRAAVESMIAAIPAGRPLAAVVHTAGVIDDAVLSSLTAERFEPLLRTKLEAARHLDSLVGSVPTVYFSSAAAAFGNPGQANYAAANAALDAFAHARAVAGMPAVSIAWGLWAQASGMTSKLTPANLAVNRRTGMTALPTEEALEILDLGLAGIHPVVVAARLATAALTGRHDLPSVLRSLVRTVVRTTATTSPAAPDSFAERLAGVPSGQWRILVDETVRAAVAVVLNYGSGQDVYPHLTFKALGIDSLTAVELRNALSTALGVRLPATLVFDYPSPEAVTGFVIGLLPGIVPVAEGAVPGAGAVGAGASAGGVAVTAGPSTGDDSTDHLGNSDENDAIAIIGMSCRFPGGVSSPEDLWRLVESGADAITGLPSERGWDIEALFDPDPDKLGKTYATGGGFLTAAADFDADFFGISPREALTIDPQQRLLLETAWEGFERAGIDPATLRGSDTGVYVGVISSDYASGLRVSATGGADVEGHLLTGSAGSVASGRVSYSFGLEGPAVTVDTACSSSLVAMHLAGQSLRRGECSLALAGGVTVMATPSTFVEFSRQRGLSVDGRCKAFAAAADGTGWGEGVGLLVLERLSDARRNGRRVWGVIRGSAVNQDGASNGLTAPNGPSQQRVIRAALASAGLSAVDVDVVEAHGTGTRLGDPIEAQALIATYGQGRAVDRPLFLGSLKSNIGHTQAAAGVGGVIKMIMAMRHGVMPKTLHVDEPSPHVDWSAGAVSLLTESAVWPVVDRPRRAAVSSFGISGTNAHVILEQPEFEAAAEQALLDLVGTSASVGQALSPACVDSAPVPWVVSGRSEAAVAGQVGALAAAFPAAAPAVVGHALLTQRAGFECRLAAVGRSTAELVAGISGGSVSGRVLAGRLGVVFPGQGVQVLGMGRGLYEAFPVFAGAFDEVCAVLDPLLGFGLREVLWAEPGSGSGVDVTGVAQPGLFAVEVALFRLWLSWGVRPVVVAGHSVGEIGAAWAAGVLSLVDACRLVVARAGLMQGLPPGGVMVAVSGSEADVAGVLGVGVQVAAVNGPGSVVLSGVEGDVVAAVGVLEGRGLRCRWLRVSHGFHSVLMDPMLDDFADAIKDIEFHPPVIAVVSTVTGERVDQQMGSAGYWVGQVRGSVRFADAVTCMAGLGVRSFLEVGPGGVLSGLIPSILDTLPDGGASVVVPSLRGADEALSVTSALASLHVHGVPVDWDAYYRTVHGVTGNSNVDLPTYAFQREHYWLPGAGEPPKTAESAEELSFWAAVDRHDLAAVAETLNLPDDESVRAVVPALSNWRRGRRQETSLQPLRYGIDWKPVPVNGPNRLTGEWMVIVPDAGGLSPADQALTDAVMNALTKHGADVVVRTVDTHTDNRAALAATLGSRPGLPPVGCLSFLGLDTRKHTVHHGLSAGLVATMVLLQALGDSQPGARLWCATRGAVATDGDRLDSPDQAMLWGLGMVAALEQPILWGGLLDLPDALDLGSADGVCAVLAGLDGEDQVAIRGGTVYGKRLRHTVRRSTGQLAWTGRGTTLITGGTGALGMAVARHLAKAGAERLMLASRSGPEAPGAAALVAELTAAGTTTDIFRCDASDRDQVAALLAVVPPEAPLSCVIHAAGLLDDGPLESLTPDRLAGVIAAKAQAAQNLHQLTRHQPLESFVTFSSIAASLGNPGQGGYAAANAYLDALVAQRAADGLPASSIAWGPWAGAGMAANRPDGSGGVADLGTEQALRMLSQVLENGDTFVMAADIDWSVFTPRHTMTRPSRLIADIPEAAPWAAVPSHQVGPDELLDRLRDMTGAERNDHLIGVVRDCAANVLGHTDVRRIELDRGFMEQGFDSLMAVQLRNRLGHAIGRNLPTAVMFDQPTPRSMASYLEQELIGDPVGQGDPLEAELRAALAATPLHRFREAGLLDTLLELAGARSAPTADDIDANDEIDEMDLASLLQFARETDGP